MTAIIFVAISLASS